MHHRMPDRIHDSPLKNPPKMNHRRFPINLIFTPPLKVLTGCHYSTHEVIESLTGHPIQRQFYVNYINIEKTFMKVNRMLLMLITVLMLMPLFDIIKAGFAHMWLPVIIVRLLFGRGFQRSVF